MQTLIELKDVTAGYDGQAQIKDVSLTIAENDFVGITGPNGGGKTTLLRTMLGLLPPMSGTIAYYQHGRPASRLTFGYLPQYNAIDRDFPITVEETVLTGLSCMKRPWMPFNRRQKEMAELAIRQMGLEQLAAHPIKALSGGQLQRTLMARAIAANPPILVFDEPNTHIDRESEDRLHDMLDRMRADHTIIMVSHDVEYVRSHARTLVEMNERATISS